MPGPRDVTFERVPFGRRNKSAKRVWFAAQAVIGCPPSWMRMIPALHKHNDVKLNTTRWIIGQEDKEPLVMDGAASKVEARLHLMWREQQNDS